jgi:hypothetical protein
MRLVVTVNKLTRLAWVTDEIISGRLNSRIVLVRVICPKVGLS